MDGSDNAFVLKNSPNLLDVAFMNVMCIGHNLAVDEGGTISQHRRNPMQQINRAKPQTPRMDNFIL